jgi:hypothetical protein
MALAYSVFSFDKADCRGCRPAGAGLDFRVRESPQFQHVLIALPIQLGHLP